jgi:hypothetical protein
MIFIFYFFDKQNSINEKQANTRNAIAALNNLKKTIDIVPTHLTKEHMRDELNYATCTRFPHHHKIKTG